MYFTVRAKQSCNKISSERLNICNVQLQIYVHIRYFCNSFYGLAVHFAELRWSECSRDNLIHDSGLLRLYLAPTDLARSLVWDSWLFFVTGKNKIVFYAYFYFVLNGSWVITVIMVV